MERVKKNSPDFRGQKIILSFILVLFFLADGSHAIDLLTVRVTNDTYICNQTYVTGSGLPNCDINLNYANQIDNFVGMCITGNARRWNPTYFKWVNINASRIVPSLYFNFSYRINPFETPALYLRYSNNQTWDELKISGNSTPGFSSSYLFPQTFNALNIPLNFSHPDTKSILDNIYQGANVTVLIDQTASFSCSAGVLGNNVTIISHDNPATERHATINLQQVDFITNLSQNTDASDLTFFDFESGFTSSVGFPEYDFYYKKSTNELYPSTRSSFRSMDSTQVNTLGNITCQPRDTTEYQVIVPAWGSINTPAGTYDVFCFNQSIEHNNQSGWFGKIKIINNTDVRGGLFGGAEFDFYWSLEDPGYSIFSTPILTPDPPQLEQNLSIRWETSQPLNTILYYRYNQTGTFTVYRTIQDLTNYGFYHNVTINKADLVGAIYQFYLAGNTTGGTYSTSGNFTFIVGAGNFANNTNSSVGGVGQALTNAGFVDDYSTGIYLIGLILLLIPTMYVWYKGGTALGLGVLVTGLGIFTSIQLLPLFLFLPFVVVLAVVIVMLFRQVFHGGGGG